MPRILALLACLALLLAPLSLAQAQPACSMGPEAAPHGMTMTVAGPDARLPKPAHHSSTGICKLICSAVSLLPLQEPEPFQMAVNVAPPRPSAILLASATPAPFDRPPKSPV
ncbi:MAG: hypothetical protein J0L76_12355 [Rhodobacterales bacterium]|nr:hypothetical protein [Rhodobacterales bacterium]